MESILRNMKLELTDRPEHADIILINTCSVRQASEDRVFGMVNNFNELKSKNQNLIIGVTGCMAGRDKKETFRRILPGVDLYFPTKDMVMLPQWLMGLNPELRDVGDMEKDYLAIHPVHDKKFQAFVTIQTGCNQYCAYCVVPYARGAEVNRQVKDILNEVIELAQNGCKEVTLLGQIVNHYVAPDPEVFSKENPYKKNDFAKLLWEINRIAGIDRIHWTAAHPLYMDDEVIDALTLPKQVNYIHLPVQSGSSSVLKRMNRKHDRDYYIEVISKIRAKKPDIAIGTDIIVGFSGETEQDFEDTVTLYKICGFDISYNAKYSPRSWTAAAKAFEDDVLREEKERRWWVLQNVMEDLVLEKNKVYEGKKLEVLVDSWDKGICSGNSREMKLVRFPGSESFVGSVIPVRITQAYEWILTAEMI